LWIGRKGEYLKKKGQSFKKKTLSEVTRGGGTEVVEEEGKKGVVAQELLKAVKTSSKRNCNDKKAPDASKKKKDAYSVEGTSNVISLDDRGRDFGSLEQIAHQKKGDTVAIRTPSEKSICLHHGNNTPNPTEKIHGEDREGVNHNGTVDVVEEL